MSSEKLFGCAINVEAAEEDGGGGGRSIAVEVSQSGIQPYWEALSLYNQMEIDHCYPYFHFLDSNSDSGSVSMDAEPELIDFFDRESFQVDTNQWVSTSGDFNIELGLGIGSGSGSGLGHLRDDSGGVRVHREIDSGPVEVGTGLTLVGDNLFGEEAMVVEGELEWENLESNWFQEPAQVISDDWLFYLDANSFFEDMMDVAVYLAEDGENDGEYDAVLAQMFDNQDGVMGSPPASKRVVDDLPVVVITSEELSNGNTIVCAICKDDIVVDEKAKRLPCKHYYHGDCIIPWLGIRNTCPVCRFELPTDDLEYERIRRSQRRGSSGSARESMSR